MSNPTTGTVGPNDPQPSAIAAGVQAANAQGEVVKISPLEEALLQEIRVVANTAMEADKEHVRQVMALGPEDVIYVNLTPQAAALLFIEHNKHNRDLSVAKVRDFAAAMHRGEWKRNHQGLAMYADGNLADGQHRTAAIAVSSTTQRLMVSGGFEKEAIDTIDRSLRRNAAQGLQMRGIEDAKIKAAVAKAIMQYEGELQLGKRPQLTDIQIEQWVIDHGEVISTAIGIGRNSVTNVSEPAMSIADATKTALLMLRGGWAPDLVVAFIASIQQGVASYPEAPTVLLNKALLKAKFSERRAHKLTAQAKLAVTLKAAQLWAQEQSVARLAWNAKKEELPTNQPPVANTDDS